MAQHAVDVRREIVIDADVEVSGTSWPMLPDRPGGSREGSPPRWMTGSGSSWRTLRD